MSHSENRRRNNRQQPSILGPDGLPPGAMEMAQQAAMQEAKVAQQQMHLQMLHQSTMREVYTKFIAQDMTDNGFRIAANKAAKAAEIFMQRLGVNVDLGLSELKEDETEGEATSGYAQQ